MSDIVLLMKKLDFKSSYIDSIVDKVNFICSELDNINTPKLAVQTVKEYK